MQLQDRMLDMAPSVVTKAEATTQLAEARSCLAQHCTLAESCVDGV